MKISLRVDRVENELIKLDTKIEASRQRLHETNGFVQNMLANVSTLEKKLAIIDTRLDALKIESQETKKVIESCITAINDLRETISIYSGKLIAIIQTLIAIGKISAWLFGIVSVIFGIYKILN